MNELCSSTVHRKKAVLFIALAFAVLGLAADQLCAQAQLTGDIAGTVTDPSKAVVAGSQSYSEERQHRSHSKYRNQRGRTLSVLDFLPPSEYSVTVEATGFQNVTEQVVVHVGQVTTLSLQLTLAGSTEKVVVTEQVPLLQVENGNTATSLSELPIHETPNGGNNIYSMLTLAPGAVMPAGGSFPSVNGMPTSSNMVTTNGMENIDPWNNGTNGGASNLLLGLNEVQEATVVTNGYTGEYGSLAGSNANIVTKGGSNAFHGNAIWFWSGRALDANNFFNNSSGTPRPFENANQWAGEFGGPIVKNKLFFYFNSEGIRIILPPSSTPSFLPTTQFEQATIANLNKAGLSASVPLYNQAFNLWNGAAGASRATNDRTGRQRHGERCYGADREWLRELHGQFSVLRAQRRALCGDLSFHRAQFQSRAHRNLPGWITTGGLTIECSSIILATTASRRAAPTRSTPFSTSGVASRPGWPNLLKRISSAPVK